MDIMVKYIRNRVDQTLQQKKGENETKQEMAWTLHVISTVFTVIKGVHQHTVRVLDRVQSRGPSNRAALVMSLCVGPRHAMTGGPGPGHSN